MQKICKDNNKNILSAILVTSFVYFQFWTFYPWHHYQESLSKIPNKYRTTLLRRFHVHPTNQFAVEQTIVCVTFPLETAIIRVMIHPFFLQWSVITSGFGTDVLPHLCFSIKCIQNVNGNILNQLVSLQVSMGNHGRQNRGRISSTSRAYLWSHLFFLFLM